MLREDPVSYLQVVDGTLYFTDDSDHTLRKMDTDEIFIISEYCKEKEDTTAKQDAGSNAPAAAVAVAGYCSRGTYTSEVSDYNTAYGVFCKGVNTCAGATRALGLVLECMGYSWTHKNPNQWTHQWCELTMDGQTGWEGLPTTVNILLRMAAYIQLPMAQHITWPSKNSGGTVNILSPHFF